MATPDNIYLATSDEIICLKLVEIKISIDIHLFHRSLSPYFGTFDLLNNHKEMFINDKKYQNTSLLLYIHGSNYIIQIELFKILDYIIQMSRIQS